ncbi:MAG TPA: sulfatase-like hydrolase/transferase [Gemmatimonadales bacterium]|nr:sulfatase-like hydrolase/transferase [Gemmatimonadales bacterium]
MAHLTDGLMTPANWTMPDSIHLMQQRVYPVARPVSASDGSSGARHFTIALILAGLAWLAMGLQELLLFVRPTPYGQAYVTSILRYFPFALYYNVLGVLLVSAPALLLWVVCYHRSVRQDFARMVHRTQLIVLLLTAALDHVDNEVMRFMGIHLTRSLLLTYFRVDAWSNDMMRSFTGDHGGPGTPFLILMCIPAILWIAGDRAIRIRLGLVPMRSRFTAATLVIAPLWLLLYQYQHHPMGQNRKLRVRPEVLTLYAEYQKDLASGARPHDLERLTQAYQQHWFEQSQDSNWVFADPDRPLLRVPTTPAPLTEGGPWNVIYIQLETFRGWNTGYLRPDQTRSFTPFLDQLAHDSLSAYWPRHLSMGPPTVSGFVSGLCSVKPHSFYNITSTFTYTGLDCLPQVLRRHGYSAEYFTAFDPDWDGETVWLQRWFDGFHRTQGGGDRALFRQAAARIRELGREPRPFMAAIASASNHYPFHSPEDRFVNGPAERPAQAIEYTMEYTDDVLREFVDSLQQEPWFAHTLIVITGDHGYNLGEHGPAGQINGYRESVWVPLLIHGGHPRLPPGEHPAIATLLDVAPTLADLAGIRDPNPWMGSSLLSRSPSATFVLSRESALLGEQGRFSMVLNPASGRPEIYDAVNDPLQRTDISATHKELADSLHRRAEDERRFVDYLLEANRVWPDSGGRADPAQPGKSGGDQPGSVLSTFTRQGKDSVNP